MYCVRFLNHFSRKAKLALHGQYCSRNEAVRIEMPDKGTMFKFKNHNRSIRVPFVIYADFESSTKPVSKRLPRSDKDFTNQHQKHNSFGFCYHIDSFEAKLYSQAPVIYRAKLLLRSSLNCLKMISRRLKRNSTSKKEMTLR